MDAQNSTVAAAGMGRPVQNGARNDLRLKMAAADVEASAGDTVPLSPSGSSEATSDSQPLSPADAGRNVAVDYMKTRYEGGEKVKKDQVGLPKVIREPRKLDFQWDKVVDEKLKRSDPSSSGPVIREQDLIGLMLTCAGLDSGRSQYLSMVESQTSAKESIPVNREPIEKVAPPEITKKVRNMFETGKLTDLHELSKTQDETYEVLPGSGVFENEPVRIEGVVRESDFNVEGEGVQRGTTKSLLDHWKTKMTDDDVMVSQNRLVVVAEAEDGTVESTPIRRDDAAREEDLDWDAAHIEKGLTKSLLSQWSNIGSTEFKSPKKRINIADAEGKVLESNPVRRSDVIREDDVITERELVQKGTTKGLLSQWSVKGTEESRTERKPIRIAEGEGRVAENEPVRRNDVFREDDVNVEGEQVEKGTTKTLLSQWKSKDKEVFSVEKRVINVAEDEGRVVESQPIRRDDVYRASDADDIETVQKGTTKSLLAQWKTKGTDDYKPGIKRPINIAEAEGKVLESEPILRSDVTREGDIVEEGEQVQKGTTRSLLNQWQNKREEFKKDKTPIVLAEADGTVAENEPKRREDVVRENDSEAEGERIQRGTTKALLNQWQNKRDDFRKEKTPIVLDEAEGTIAENEPIRRTDVVREEDFHAEGEVVQRGTTKSLLNQWKFKGSQEFVAERRPIDIVAGEGKVAENEPVQRSDVVHGYDVNMEDEQVQKGLLKSLREQWKKKGAEEFKIAKRNIVIEEDEGRVVENEPQIRDDVTRENELDDEVQVQKGFTKSLLGQWKSKGSEEFKAPKREIVIAEDDGKVAENQPSPRHDVFREDDNSFETPQVQKGLTRNLLGQWKSKGSEEFRATKREIILAEDEGTVAENNPEQRIDIVREGDFNGEGEKIQKGYTKSLLGQWKNKGNEAFKGPKREIILAEDEGKIAESQPQQRNDVVREYDANLDEDKIQKGYTKNLLGQWKNKGNETFKAPKREIILAGDEGKIAENDPVQRSDVTREYDANGDEDKIQKGYTKNLLGQWKNKGHEEFKAPKKDIAWADDEGKISENQPQQRSDVVREYDMNTEGEQVQRGMTKSLLGQWKNKGSEEFRAPKREIVLAEDEGKVAENEPEQRSDVYREYDANQEGEKIQKGYTKNLLGQWKNKGNEEFKAPKREIVIAEDEGKIAESQPQQRNDVFREFDDNSEGEKIQKGYTKNLLGQWKTKGSEEFKAPRKEIAWAENEGKISENEPVQRSDVTREDDANLEGEKIQKGYTKNLLGQWKNKGNEEFRAQKREIVLAEDEGKVAENDPVQRSDVTREYDANGDEDKIQKGYTKNLLGQWKNKGNEEFKAPKKDIAWADDEGKISENQPQQRNDVVREYDMNTEGEQVQRGMTKSLLGQWKTKGSEGFKAPKREIVLAEDEGKIAENEPEQRTDVYREYDANQEGEKIQKGYTKNLLGQWKNKGNEEYNAPKKEIILAGDEGKIAENDPVQRSDVTREYDANGEEDNIQKGFTKNLMGQWKTKGSEEFKAPKQEIAWAENEGKISENEPVQRSDVTREYDENQETEKIQKGYTKNLLGQWKNKGNEEFKAPKKDIAWADDEGKIAENNPVQRSDVTREYDANLEGESIQKGFTKNLMGQWKTKGSEEFKAPKHEIAWAENEGKISENEPVQRSDVTREYDANHEGESIQKGFTKNLMGQWKTKGSEEFKAPKQEIAWAENEGKISENEPVQRSDVTREYDENLEGEQVQKGSTRSLLGQWRNKGNEEFKTPKREIVLAEDEGKIAENQPVQRSDVIREDDASLEGEKIQRGNSKNLLGHWKNKGNEEFKAQRKEIVLAEDEGKVAENNPVQRSDVIREDDANTEGERIQRGNSKNLLGQWKDKGNEEFKAPQKDIAWAEDEGKIAENQPLQRNDVVREDDLNMEGEQVQRGMTKSMLGQWKNKGSEEFKAPKREIVLAEDEGRIVENEPLRRNDVVRELDENLEGEKIQRGTTRNLLGQWKDKGTQQFSQARREIVLAEDEGMVAENDPVQRCDVTRETDYNLTRELPQKGQAQNLKVQWMSSRDEAPKEREPVNIMENENEPSVVENDPVQRNDVVREGDNFEEVFLKRGFARDLAGYWQDRKQEEPQKEPFRLEMDVSKDEMSVHENQPIELEGVTRYTDELDEVMGKRGLIQMVAKQYLEPAERPSPRSRDQINMDLADGPTILENDPIPVGPDVVRSDYSSIDDTSVTAGFTKNMLDRWKYQSLESSSPRTPSSLVDGKPAWVVEMEEAPGSGVFENQPEVRTDVTREVDYEPEMIPIKQTRNTRRMWSQMEQEEEDMPGDKDLVPELVRFTPPRELTPPPVHQEDFKSYQTITFSSGPSTSGPKSPPSQPQPGWSPSILGPRQQPPQNHSGQSASPQKSQQSKRGTGAAYRMQSSPQGINATYRKPQPAMGATYNNDTVQPEATMKSSAVLILRPS